MFPAETTIRDVYEYPESQMRKDTEMDMNEKYNSPTVVYKDQEKTKKKKNVKDKVVFKIKVIGRIASFVQNLKSTAILNKPNFRKEELEYIMIDDLEKNQKKVSIRYEDKYLLFCQIWSYILFLMILWKGTFELVLGDIDKQKYIESLGLITCILFGILNINSQIKNEKLALVSDKDKIREVYIKNNLIPDLFAITGMLLILTPLNDLYIQVFYLARICLLPLVFRTSWIFQRLQKQLTTSRQSEATIYLIKLFLRIVISLHILSLFLIVLAKIEHLEGAKMTWIEKSGYKGIPPHELYIYSWYWSCTIISTVGFGDISPGNALQSAIISVLQIFSCIIFGYFINYIGSLLNIFGESKQNFEREIRRLNNYLHKLQVTDDLRDEARSILFNKYKTLQLYDKAEEEKISSNLTENLIQSLFLDNNFNVLKNSKLKTVFKEEFLSEITQHLEKTVIASEDYLFTENQKKLNLWIVEDGTIHEIPAKNLISKPLSIYNKKENNTIGWINFFKGDSYNSWGIAKTFSIVYKLEKDIFYEKLKEYKREFLKFHEIKEYLIEKGKKFENKCLGCGKLSHNVINCSRIHFVPKKITFILEKDKKKAEINGENERKLNNRRRMKKKDWKANELSKDELKKSSKKRKGTHLFDKFNLNNSFQAFFKEELGHSLKTQKQVFSANSSLGKQMGKRLKKKKSSEELEVSKVSCVSDSIKSYFSSEKKIDREQILRKIDCLISDEIDEFRPKNNWQEVMREYMKYNSDFLFDSKKRR